MSGKIKKSNEVRIDRLKELMDNDGLSDYELSAKTGIDRSNINKYYNQVRNVPLGDLIKFADFYGVTVDYLLGRTEGKSRNAVVAEMVDYTGLTDEAIKLLHDNCKHKNLAHQIILFGEKSPTNDFVNCFLTWVLGGGDLQTALADYEQCCQEIEEMTELITDFGKKLAEDKTAKLDIESPLITEWNDIIIQADETKNKYHATMYNLLNKQMVNAFESMSEYDKLYNKTEEICKDIRSRFGSISDVMFVKNGKVDF
jgi:transcriptional regulator with XRE-family HTH domain